MAFQTIDADVVLPYPSRITSVSPTGSGGGSGGGGVIEFPGGIVVPIPEEEEEPEVAFVETPRFPRCPSFGSSIGPSFSTQIVSLKSGYEARNQNWQCERLMFDLSHVGLTASERAEIAIFHRAMRGSKTAFRIKDHTDFEVKAGEGILVAVEGESGVYVMKKRYTYSTLTYDRDIYKPVQGKVKIFDSNVEMTTGFSVDYTTGRVTITSGSGPFTWTGEFDVPVRFVNDALPWTVIDSQGDVSSLLYTCQNLQLIEVRP